MKQRHWIIDALIALVCGGGLVVWLGYFGFHHPGPGSVQSAAAPTPTEALPSASVAASATPSSTPDATLYLIALGSADSQSLESAAHVARALEHATPNLPEDMHIRIYTNARHSIYRYSLSHALRREEAETVLQRAHNVGWKDEVFLTHAEGWTLAK